MPIRPVTTDQRLSLALAAFVLLVVGDARVAQAQRRVVITAEGGIDRPIGRDARRARSGPVGGLTVESGNAAGAFMATFMYSQMASKTYRTTVDQGDIDLWGLTVGAIRRTRPSRPIAGFATIAAGVAIVEETGRSFEFVEIPARTDWQPVLSAGLGAEYRRAALLFRLRSELWVQPLTYSRDGYGARAAVRTTLGIGLVR